jgi:hypothetical protein
MVKEKIIDLEDAMDLLGGRPMSPHGSEVFDGPSLSSEVAFCESKRRREKQDEERTDSAKRGICPAAYRGCSGARNPETFESSCCRDYNTCFYTKLNKKVG